jgi:negative regulator of flagellin synthesis FlgM
MKIYGNKPPEGPSGSSGTNKVPKPPVTGKSSGTDRIPSTDKVEISGKGKEIADIMAAVNQLPDVRTDKVNQAKQAIESGSYTVDSSKVAQNILKEI